MQCHCDSLTECCPDTRLHVGGLTGSAAAAAAAATACASLTIKSTTLNHDHGAAFILGTYDCLYYNVLGGVIL